MDSVSRNSFIHSFIQYGGSTGHQVRAARELSHVLGPCAQGIRCDEPEGRRTVRVGASHTHKHRRDRGLQEAAGAVPAPSAVSGKARGPPQRWG